MAGMAKQAKRAVRKITRGWRNRIIHDSPDWLRRTFGRAASYGDMLFIDHGIFRVIYLNKHKISDEAWRTAQPTPAQIRRLAREGVRTIVNLRGDRVCGSYYLEKEACAKAGIHLVNYCVRSRAAPTKEEVLGARDLFQNVEYPIVMHCKSGADRAGLMSVLYRHFREGVPIEIAKGQLDIRYGHFRQADTGVLDYFFERYLAETKDMPLSFEEWLTTVYQPDELKASFIAKGWANRLVNTILQRE